MANKQLSYTAERVDELLGIVDGLGEATTTEAGLMSAEDKAKLDGIEGDAEENIIEEVQVGGTALTPADKVVNIPADSAPTSDSTNLVRSGGVYAAIQQVANALLNYYTKAQVDALLAGVHQFTYQVVAELPDASADTMFILYFVPSSDPQTQNVKDEYITIRTGSEGAYAYSWEHIGSTEIDLSDYPTTEEMNAAITTAVASKADKDDDAVEGNLAKFDANGNPIDAGIAAEKVAKKGEVQTFAGNLVDTRSAGTRQGPFAFRQSGGDGVNYMRKILGKTVAWNQLVNQLTTPVVSGDTAHLSATKEANGRIKIVLSAPVSSLTQIIFENPVTAFYKAGHRYFISLRQSNNLTPYLSYTEGNGVWWQRTPSNLTTSSAIWPVTTTTDAVFTIYVGTTLPTGTYYIYPQVTDLTLAGLDEVSTVADFDALYPNPRPYNPGTLISNAATGLETTGFNQYNPTTGTAQVIAGKTYYIGGTYTSISQDGETITPENHLFTPANTGEVVVVGGNDTDTIINISDASRNGTYEPYWKRERVLGITGVTGIPEGGTEADRVTIFPDGMAGVGTAQDMFYEENGVAKAKKVMAVVDLGNLIYSREVTDEGGKYRFKANNLPEIKPATSASALANILCNKYTTISAADTYVPITGVAVNPTQYYSGALIIYVEEFAAYSTADFKTAMAGTMLNYELATPVVYTDLQNADGTPFVFPKMVEVDNLGTEKRLPEDTADNPQAPFECDSNYSISVANLVRKLNS